MKSELKPILQLLLSGTESPPPMFPAISTIDDSSLSSSSSSTSPTTNSSSSSNRTDNHRNNSTKSIMRRSVLIIGSFTFLFFATSKGIVDETSFYLSSMPSSSLRGGGYMMLPLTTSSKTNTIATTHNENIEPSHHRGSRRSGRQRQDQDGQRRNSPLRFGFLTVHQSIDGIGSKIHEVVEEVIVKQWSQLQENIGSEWFKLLSNIEKIFPLQQQRNRHHRSSITSSSKKLDDVIHAFQSVLNRDGNNDVIDTAQLLKACRAHLVLMKSGGTALRLVAKDLETNLLKAETLFQKIISNNRKNENGMDLAALLQIEIDRGVHPDANILEESSAAMGLLWIRRSLAYQLELYTSLGSPSPSPSISGDAGRHPRDAALQAYNKTLAPYHGWFLQKIFPLSLSQMPDRQVFLAKFGGREVRELDEQYERIIEMKLQLLVRTWKPILDVWRREFERLNLEDTRRA